MIYKKSAKFHVASLTKNLKTSDFECPCRECDGENQRIDLDLVSGIQAIWDAGKLPVGVVSGYRCRSHNYKIGGTTNSPHLDGLGADIYSIGRTSLDLAKLALHYGGFRNFGLFKNGIHVDERPWKGRLRIWTYPGAELTIPEFREIMEQELEIFSGTICN